MSTASIQTYPDLPDFIRVGQTVFVSGIFSFKDAKNPTHLPLDAQIQNIFDTIEKGLSFISYKLSKGHITELSIIHRKSIPSNDIGEKIRTWFTPLFPLKLRFILCDSFPQPVDIQIAARADFSAPIAFETTDRLISFQPTLREQMRDLFVTQIGVEKLPRLVNLRLFVSSLSMHTDIIKTMEILFNELHVAKKNWHFAQSIIYCETVPTYPPFSLEAEMA